MRRTLKIPFSLFLAAMLFVASAFGAMRLSRSHLFAEVDVSILTNYNPSQTSWVLDTDGNSILCFAAERRTVIPLEKMGDLLPQVVIAAEDKNFNTRWGPVDVERSIKAVWQGKGGSTISQQLARLIYLQEEKHQEEFWAERIRNEVQALQEKYTRRARVWQKIKIFSLRIGKTYVRYMRKVRETYIAYRLEKTLGRERILEIYLNHAYFGERYGVAEASSAYFDKPPDELDLSEAALVAGLIRSPYYSSPFRNPEKARELRNRVLQQLVDAEVVTQEEANDMKGKPLGVKHGGGCRESAPHFAEIVRRELVKRYSLDDIRKSGLRIYTTLDSRIQKAAQEALGDSLAKLKERNPELANDVRGAAVVVDVKTGGVRAWVEEPKFSENEYDLIRQARRQAGSAFKPVFYGKLLERGWRLRCDDEGTGPCTLYDIAPKPESRSGIRIAMGRGKPPHYIQNFPYEGIPRYRGAISPQIAIAESRNAATESAVAHVGGSPVPPFWRVEIEGELDEFAKRIGIESTIDPSLTTPIGSTEVTLLEMTRVFSTYDRGCKKLDEYMIEGIKDSKNEPIEWHNSVSPQEVCDERTSLQILRGLRGTVELPHGTGGQAKAQLDFQVIGKTGTATNNAGEATDNWFIGCTPSYCMGVWVGRDKKLPLGLKETGGKNALPVFIGTMKDIYQNREKEVFPDATDPIKPFALPKLAPAAEQPKADDIHPAEESQTQDDY